MPAAAAELPNLSAWLTGVCSSAASMQHVVLQRSSGRAALKVSTLGAAPPTDEACCVPWCQKGAESMPPAGTVHEPPIMRLPYDPQNMRLPKLVGAKAFTILSWNVNSIKTLLNKVGSLAEVEACRWCHAPKSLPEALPVACGLIVYHRCCPCLSHSRLGWLYLLSHGCLAVQLQATTLLRLEGAWLVRPNGACITLCALAL